MERWDAHKFCLEVDGKIIGKALYLNGREIEGQMDKYRTLWSTLTNLRTPTAEQRQGYTDANSGARIIGVRSCRICNVDRATTYL